MYTVQLLSTCSVCHERHISLPHKSYLMHYTALPFNCEHGHRIEDMMVVEPDSRTRPFVTLPPDIRRLAPDCLSESSGGILTPDKLDKVRKRLQDAFSLAEESFQALALTVSTTGVDTQGYPQYSLDHVNYLLAAIESNVDECIGYLDAHKENLSRLAEVEEADAIRISDEGNVTGVHHGVDLQQPEIGLGDGLQELAAATAVAPKPSTQTQVAPNTVVESEMINTSSSGSLNTVVGQLGSIGD